MEAKLDEHLEAGEFYAAHQLLLSLGQRHQRAGRWSKSLGILGGGLVRLGKAGAPQATIHDLAGKLVQVVGDQQREAAAARMSKEKTGAAVVDPEKTVNLRELLEPVWEVLLREEEEEAVGGDGNDQPPPFWLEWSGHLAGAIQFRAEWAEVAQCFYQHLAATDGGDHHLLAWILADCLAVPGVFKQWAQDKAPALDPASWTEQFGWALLMLLRLRSFASAGALLQAALEQVKGRGMRSISIDDGSGSLPGFLCLLSEDQIGDGDGDLKSLICTLNMAQLLFLLCQRASPSAEALGRLEERYGRVILDRYPPIKEQFGLLKAHYWPPKRSTGMMNGGAGNPLAALLQGMMGGGGFPGMQPPQSSTVNKKKSTSTSTNHNNRIDLD